MKWKKGQGSSRLVAAGTGVKGKMIATSLVLPQKSSVFFLNLWQSSEISENVQKCLSGLWTTFGEFSEIFGKCLEIFGKFSKMLSLVCLYNKQNNTWLLVDMEFLFLCSTLYLTSECSNE